MTELKQEQESGGFQSALNDRLKCAVEITLVNFKSFCKVSQVKEDLYANLCIYRD